MKKTTLISLSFIIIICYVRIILVKAQDPKTIQLLDSTVSNTTLGSGQVIHYMYNASQAGNVLSKTKNNLITQKIFITLTICKQPLSTKINNTAPDETLKIFYSNYSSTPSANDNIGSIALDYGFASKNLTNYQGEVLYIGVFAPNLSTEFVGAYIFQIGVSLKGTYTLLFFF